MTDLFNEKTIKRIVEISDLNISKIQKDSAKKWIEFLETGKLEKEKEGYLDFANLVLKNILGYDIGIESLKHEEGNMEFSFKKSSGNYLVCFEAKGTKTKDLWAYQNRNSKVRETPVNQIWDYMGRYVIPYGVLTNYKEFVLFDREKSYNDFYKFDFLLIKENPEKLKEFVKIFSKESLDNGFVEKIRVESDVEEKRLTDKFYKLFHETRLMLLREFMENGRTREEALHYAQLFLNRLMFVFFAEDINLIPQRIFEKNLIKSLENCSENSSHFSDEISVLFEDLDKGDSGKEIQQFNGGLFHERLSRDAYFQDLRKKDFFKEIYSEKKNLITDLSLSEEEFKIFNRVRLNGLSPIIENMLLMASFDFKSDLKVNILGHIFEQSLSDLEELNDENVSKRKKDGIFYTPEYITDYICRNTIVPYLSKSGTNSTDELIEEYSKDLENLEEKFKKIKILDPACGSGAFLIKAVDVLFEIFEKIQNLKQSWGEYEVQRGLKTKSKIKGQLTFKKFEEKDKIREIIENNIYGVDLNEESIETTKLSLFLRIAKKGKKLPDLSEHIKCGNSLIDDENVAGKKAFKWKEEFKEIFENGGFDVVIGNPPYGAKLDEKVVKHCNKFYETGNGNYDTYTYFMRLIDLLVKEKGFVGYITPNTWLNLSSYSELRKNLLEEYSIIEVINLLRVFEDAMVDCSIEIFKKGKQDNIKTTIERYEQVANAKTKLECFKSKNYSEKYSINSNIWDKPPNFVFNYLRNPLFEKILKKVEEDNIHVKEILDSSRGASFYGVGAGNPPQTKEIIENRKYSSNYKKDSTYYPSITGGDIGRYILFNPQEFISYGKWLFRSRESKFFFNPHLLVQRFRKGMKRQLIATYTHEEIVNNDGLSNFIQKDKSFDLKYLLILFNSKLLDFWFQQYYKDTNVRPTDINNIPIPKISPDEQRPFVEKADEMLNLNKEFYEKKSKFLNRVHELGIEKISKKMDKFFKLSFDEFVKELLKQKINLNLK
ncbi:hypothetical protein AUJ61_03210, partial [Candidatus Pacearchaeota archaeon CG1_02_30_18]